jgi:glutamate racemase
MRQRAPQGAVQDESRSTLSAQMPIGVFDSGLGGLDVAAALTKAMPNERLIYLGDTARVPYGTRSPETVLQYAREAAHFLLNQGVKVLVVACNTASAYALHQLQAELAIPVFGMIDAGVQAIGSYWNEPSASPLSVLVLATPGTIRSQAYQDALSIDRVHRQIFAHPCPLFVPLVEAGWSDRTVAHAVVVEQLREVTLSEDPPFMSADVVLLGCTHYPLLRPVISGALRTLFNTEIPLIDGAAQVALNVDAYLRQSMICASERAEEHLFFMTDDPSHSRALADRFWRERSGEPLPALQWTHL